MCTAVSFGEDTDCTAGTIASCSAYGTDRFHRPEVDRPHRHQAEDHQYRSLPNGNRILRTSTNSRPGGKAASGCGGAVWPVPEEGILFEVKPYLKIFSDEMHAVRYCFDYLNVRVDYCGDPVLRGREQGSIGFPTRQRAFLPSVFWLHLYTPDEVTVSPSKAI